MDAVTVQKLVKTIDKKLDLAIRYYSILSIVNNLNLSDKQVKLLSFTAVRGNITYRSIRKEFAELFDTSLNYIEKMKSKLIKLNLLVKIDDKYKINPLLDLDFSKDLVLQLHFTFPNGE